MTTRLRLLPTFNENLQTRVDRENLIIHDVVAMTANTEAIGHNIMSDSITLTMMQALGNNGDPFSNVDYIRSRFGHPGMSENATGKKVAKAKNFRIEGDKLVHDSYLLSVARKSAAFGGADVVEYLLDVAEHEPAELGESVVIDHDLVWVMPDGIELDIFDNRWKDQYQTDESGRPIDATNPLPIIRPITFHYVDFVNEGALTHDGLFDRDFIFSGGDESQFLGDLFLALDAFRHRYGISLEAFALKADRTKEIYLLTRGKTERNPMSLKTRGKRFEQAVVTPEESPPPEQDQETDDLLDDALLETEETNDDLSEQEEDGDFALRMLVSSLQSTVATHEDQIAKLARLATIQADSIRLLSNRIKALESEPFTRASVPPNPIPAPQQHPAKQLAGFNRPEGMDDLTYLSLVSQQVNRSLMGVR